jgi:hypothetical protein
VSESEEEEVVLTSAVTTINNMGPSLSSAWARWATSCFLWHSHTPNGLSCCNTCTGRRGWARSRHHWLRPSRHHRRRPSVVVLHRAPCRVPGQGRGSGSSLMKMSHHRCCYRRGA